MPATSDAAAPAAPATSDVSGVCIGDVFSGGGPTRESDDHPEIIQDAVNDATKAAREARNHSEMAQACWIWTRCAQREMRNVMATSDVLGPTRESDNLPEVIEDAVIDAIQAARDAAQAANMAQSCWLMIQYACRDMRNVMSMIVPDENLPPPELLVLGRVPHGPAPHQAVPDNDDTDDRAAPALPTPPALQVAADVRQSVERLRGNSRFRLRRTMRPPAHDAPLIAAIRRQG